MARDNDVAVTNVAISLVVVINDAVDAVVNCRSRASNVVAITVISIAKVQVVNVA